MDSLRNALLQPNVLQQSGVYELASHCGLVAPPPEPCSHRQYSMPGASAGGGPLGSVPCYQGLKPGVRHPHDLRSQSDTELGSFSLLAADSAAISAAAATATLRERLAEISSRKSAAPAIATGRSDDDEVAEDQPMTPGKESTRARRSTRVTELGSAGREAKPSPQCAAKGLRHFAVKVLEQVQAHGVTSYQEVGDSLVQDLLQNSGDADMVYDEKNVRRRVYDAINVLKAMDIIRQGSAKELVWNGLPTRPAPAATPPRAGMDGDSPGSAGAELSALRAERARLMQSNGQLLDTLENLVQYQRALKALLQRNCAAHPAGRPPASAVASHGLPEERFVPYPFVLIKTSHSTTVNVRHSDDMMECCVEFGGQPFELQDGLEVLYSASPPTPSAAAVPTSTSPSHSVEYGNSPNLHHPNASMGLADSDAAHGNCAGSGGSVAVPSGYAQQFHAGAPRRASVAGEAPPGIAALRPLSPVPAPGAAPVPLFSPQLLDASASDDGGGTHGYAGNNLGFAMESPVRVKGEDGGGPALLPDLLESRDDGGHGKQPSTLAVKLEPGHELLPLPFSQPSSQLDFLTHWL